MSITDKARDRKNRDARGRYRRSILEELGFRGTEALTNEELDRMIDNPSGLRSLVENIERTGNKPNYGILNDLEAKGIRLPESTTEKMIETRARKFFERVNLAEHYAEQIMFDTGAKTPLEIGVEVKALHIQVYDEIVSKLHEHIDINYISKAGNHISYQWGEKTLNPVVDLIKEKLAYLEPNQVVWLANAISNGSLLSDTMVYDSDGDGYHTRFLASVHHLVSAAKDVGDEGYHPRYGDLTASATESVFKSIGSQLDENDLNSLTTEEKDELKKYVEEQRKTKLIKNFKRQKPTI